MLDMGFEPQIRKIVEQTDMPPPGFEGRNCYADGHYFQTLFYMIDPAGIANWSVKYVDWSERKWHQISYKPQHISPKLIRNLTHHLYKRMFYPSIWSEVIWNGDHTFATRDVTIGFQIIKGWRVHQMHMFGTSTQLLPIIMLNDLPLSSDSKDASLIKVCVIRKWINHIMDKPEQVISLDMILLDEQVPILVIKFLFIVLR